MGMGIKYLVYGTAVSRGSQTRMAGAAHLHARPATLRRCDVATLDLDLDLAIV
jgi:hypothetical protein